MRATKESIATDQMQYLKDNRDVCAKVCIHAGNHCMIRYHAGEWEYLTTGEWREKHFHRVSPSTVRHIFAKNTVQLLPTSDAKWWRPSDPAWVEHGRVANV